MGMMEGLVSSEAACTVGEVAAISPTIFSASASVISTSGCAASSPSPSFSDSTSGIRASDGSDSIRGSRCTAIFGIWSSGISSSSSDALGTSCTFLFSTSAILPSGPSVMEYVDISSRCKNRGVTFDLCRGRRVSVTAWCMRRTSWSRVHGSSGFWLIQLEWSQFPIFSSS